MKATAERITSVDFSKNNDNFVENYDQRANTIQTRKRHWDSRAATQHIINSIKGGFGFNNDSSHPTMDTNARRDNFTGHNQTPQV